MKKLILSFLIISISSCNSPVENNLSKWEQQANQVTIIRDQWGIPHIYGKTDADTVFGLMYAQAEDDFNRVEMNYINAMGRLAETEGESELYRDLRMKLFIDPDEMKKLYAQSPEWLKKLMNAFADGLNYYLHTHPDVKPKVIKHFEPWMALTFSEGSIGGDIERVSIKKLTEFYSSKPKTTLEATVSKTIIDDKEPRGSNGFAIAPKNSASGNALLLINPHTSFFFRSEVHMISEEGLNAYGAVTWGQFFVYQGFNDKTGWMHTSSYADAIDEYLETIIKKDNGLYYLYGDQEKPLISKIIKLPYTKANIKLEKEIQVYYTHHGPVIRDENGKWVSIKLMQEPVKALSQSYLRTKAKNHDEFHKTMQYYTNSSNNTVYADADGNIAYYHGNFIPKRDPQFDWNKPVDGNNPATEWQGLHTTTEAITLLNPVNGWIQNTNNWPYSAAGANSPKQENYPRYMATGSENPRGIHALKVLQNKSNFTLDSLIHAAYDPYLTAFDQLLPPLFKAYDALDKQDDYKSQLRDKIEQLRVWDRQTSATSTATSLAIFWAQELMNQSRSNARKKGINIYKYMANNTTFEQRLQALSNAVVKLENDFGSWKTAWGDINRYQRINGEIVQPFNDNKPSLPVSFASGRWGALASYGSRSYPGTKKMYGTSGNSFVAVVEFGKKLKAKAVTVGGLSSDPTSRHFNDQDEMYITGRFRDVLFYKQDIEQNIERQYHPGK